MAVALSLGAVWLPPVLERTLLGKPSRAVRIAAADAPPYTYVRDGTFSGPNYELFQAAAQRLGLSLAWQPLTGDAVETLESGDADLILSLAETPEQAARIHLSPPWVHSELVILSRRDRPPVLPLEPGPRTGSGLTAWVFDHPVDVNSATRYLPGAELRRSRSRAEALSRICRGEGDVLVVTSRLGVLGLLDRPPECSGVALEWTELPNVEVRVVIGAARGWEKVGDLLSREIRSMWADGTTSAIYRRHGAHIAMQSRSFITVATAAREREAAEQSQRLLISLCVLLGSGLLLILDARRREMEARLAAEAAGRAKTDFLATVSHELRTPINGFLGLSGLLLDTPLSPSQQELATTAAESAEHLLGIVNEILDIAAVEAGRLTLQPAPFNLEQIIHHVARSVRASVAERDVEVDETYATGLGRNFVGDGRRIRQILFNLASNAEKFTAAGRITIAAEPAPEGWVRISVTDTGIGIPAELQSRIFDKFEQGDSSRSRRYGGTGLGLAVVKQLAEAMGGRVGVESEPGRGSRFWVDLPLAEAGEMASIPTVPGGNDRLTGRILVAEDNLVNQRLLVRVLEKHGLAVDVAGDGAAAVTAALQFPYDAILMDCQMPLMDGLEATRQIRAQLPRRVPILALTANAFPGERERCLGAGMDDFVSKPFKIKELMERLSRWIRSAEMVGGPNPVP